IHHWSERARQESLFAFYKSYQHMPYSTTDSFKEDDGRMVYDGSEFEDARTLDETFDFQTKTILDIPGEYKQQVRFGVAGRSKDRDGSRHLSETDEDGKVTDLTTSADSYRIDEDYLAAFAQDQVWLTDTFSLLPGMRAEYLSRDSRDGGGTTASTSETDWNPTFHALYQPSRALAFHFGFSRTVNRPQFDQLSPYRRINDDDEEVEVGNPDLDPARSWNFDLGAEWDNGPLFLGANVFYKKIRDIIQSDIVGTEIVGGDPYDLYQARNVGDGWLKGVEFDERFRFSRAGIRSLDGLELWANQSIYSSRVKYDNGTSSPFEEQPEFILNLGADYLLEKTGTRLSLSGNFVGDFDWSETDGTRIGYDSEWVVNLGAHQRIADGLEAYVEVINLFDEERFETERKTSGDYRNELITGGRSVVAGLNYRF
ncbi:MAG: TonB-dependent receptor, partial [Verrucomicrobiae bacterium]|nr:TonB-dependent receptor [Verrucomicrobiae bacterium]